MALKRNLIANYLGQGWTALIGLAFVPLYIKYLGIEAYGLIGLYAMLQTWFSLLDMGITPTLGREMARFTSGIHSRESIRDLLRSIEVVIVCVAVLIAGGVALGANWIATYWLKADVLPVEIMAQAFVIMGIVVALRFVEGIYRSAIVGLQLQVLFNVVNSSMATLRAIGAVLILAWVSPTIWAFFLWQGVVSIATLVILCVATYSCVPKGVRGGRFSLESLRSVWHFAGGMVGITLLALLLTQVDKVLLSKLLNLTEFGYYTLAGTVASALYILVGPITQAFYPRFCELIARNDKVALADSYHKGAQLVSVIAGSAAIVLIFFAETFLELWTNDVELAGKVGVLLSLLTLGNLLNGLMWIPYQIQLAHGLTSLTIYINIVAVLFIVPAILWVVPRYGMVGAAWVWVVLNAGYNLIAMPIVYMKIMTAEKWTWFRDDVLAPLVAALLCVGMMKFFWPKQETVSGQIIVLVCVSFISIFVSGIVSNHIRRQLQVNLKSILKKIGRKSHF